MPSHSTCIFSETPSYAIGKIVARRTLKSHKSQSSRFRTSMQLKFPTSACVEIVGAGMSRNTVPFNTRRCVTKKIVKPTIDVYVFQHPLNMVFETSCHF
jgi:hypothetical protein